MCVCVCSYSATRWRGVPVGAGVLSELLVHEVAQRTLPTTVKVACQKTVLTKQNTKVAALCSACARGQHVDLFETTTKSDGRVRAQSNRQRGLQITRARCMLSYSTCHIPLVIFHSTYGTAYPPPLPCCRLQPSKISDTSPVIKEWTVPRVPRRRS